MFPSQTITYTGVTIYAVEGCIIDKGNTLNQTKKTCTHELGQLLVGSGIPAQVRIACINSDRQLLP